MHMNIIERVESIAFEHQKGIYVQLCKRVKKSTFLGSFNHYFEPVLLCALTKEMCILLHSSRLKSLLK